jgi:hypothetical protein
MKKRAEWVKLEAGNLEHVTKNQWPPVSYFEQLEAYERAVGKSADGCNVM